MRFEITGGSGRTFLPLEKIIWAIKLSGGVRTSRRYAFGLSNQPKVCSFSADNLIQADEICEKASQLVWPKWLLCYPIEQRKGV